MSARCGKLFNSPAVLPAQLLLCVCVCVCDSKGSDDVHRGESPPARPVILKILTCLQDINSSSNKCCPCNRPHGL